VAWASDQAGPAGFNPTHTGWAEPSPKNKNKIKK